jgi:hypothetical protein
MGYFTYLAKQTFGDSPTGERLYFPAGPFARPYLIPSAEVEERLFRKQLWLSRLLVGGLILLQPVLFAVLPILMESAFALAAYIALVTLASMAITHVVLRRDVASLSRGPERLSIRTLLVNLSRRHSTRTLVLGLVGSLAFVAIGFVAIATGTNPGSGWISVAFFGLCAVAWAYALDLRHSDAE